MQRFIMSAALLLALAMGLLGTRSVSAQDAFLCSDYLTYAAANVAFIEAGGPDQDPNGADPDRDGFPCEDLPGAPEEASTATEGLYPWNADIVGSGAAPADTSSSSGTIVGSGAASASDSLTDESPTVADQTDGDDTPAGNTIVGSGASVNSAEDAPAEAADEPADDDGAGLGEVIGAEGWWAEDATGGDVTTMPSTGSGVTASSYFGFATLLFVILCVLALGTGSGAWIRSRRV